MSYLVINHQIDRQYVFTAGKNQTDTNMVSIILKTLQIVAYFM